MPEGPSFEKYPGSPGRDDASYRVISPWRDALAWVSIAGPLALTRYLVRDDSGWRVVAASNDVVIEPADAVWELVWRDPVELMFRTTIDGVDATARVTVARSACEIRISAGADAARVMEAICVPLETMVEQGVDGDVLLRLASTWTRQQ